MNKKIEVWLFLLTIWIFVILTIFFGYSVWYIDQGGKRFGEKTTNFILNTARFPQLVKQSFIELTGNNPLIIQDDKFKDVSQFKFEKSNSTNNNYILLSSYDARLKQSTVDLISTNSRNSIYKWIPNINEICSRISHESDITSNVKHWKKSLRICHPLLSRDGSLIFIIGGVTIKYGGALVKIDAHSKLLWIIFKTFHHSLEYSADGNIWTPCLMDKGIYNFESNGDCYNDAILKVSPDGKVLFERSIADLLIKQGYRGLLWGVSPLENDPLHINDIQPSLSTSKYWKKDDLLISMRHKSTVFLYRPSIDSIIWLKTGPWLNQHDVDFVDATRIGIFGNNVIRKSNDLEGFLVDGYNEEYVFDFSNGKVTTPYSVFLKKAGIRTKTEGRSDIMENGDLFVEETNNGRLLLGDQKNIIWQYIDRIDKHSIGVVTWSRIITEKEFQNLAFLNLKRL